MRRVSLLVAVPVLLLVLAGGVWVFFQQSGRPWRAGERQLPGLRADVTVRFDARGVPHVDAASTEDLFTALGFLHANDRLTQMELGRRAAAGRLGELVGEPALEFDLYFHRLGFPQATDALWRAASPESKAVLEAYAAGVNAFLDARGDLPPGLRMLGADPEPWRPQDSLAFTLLMARDLSFWNARPEEERFLWLRAFGPETVRELLGLEELHVPESILALAEETAGDRGSPDPQATAPLFGDGAHRGSNNWAVGPSRAAAGRAMVANDPHLPLFLPSVWYQVQLRAPDYAAAGMSLPGTPGVVLGRGPHVAWAFTNVMLDDHDVFFERLDDEGRYLRGDRWLEPDRKTVTIRLRGGETRPIAVRSTDRGPLLDADPALGLPARSLAWTALRPGDPVAALLGVARARTPDELVAATRPYVAPAQNLVAAFESGELVHTMLGKVPERLRGDGRLPSPGWDPTYGWSGLRTHAEHPRTIAPAEDLIVTANHDIVPADYALPFAADFFGPSRADRIRERLLAEPTWRLEDFAALQVDRESLHAGEVIELLAADGPFTGDAATAFETLRAWDRRLEVRGASALWVLVEKELLERIWGDETRAAGLPKPLGHRDRLLWLLRGEMSERFVDDVTTEIVEERREIVAASLAAAWSAAKERWGGDVARWSYGDVHRLTLAHRLDAVPLYGRWSRRGPHPVPGSATTILAFGGVWDGDHQRILYGPSMRFITDWSDPDRSWAVVPGGQSGHPADPHYDDQIAPYLAGELFEAPWSDAAIDAATVTTLTLRP